MNKYVNIICSIDDYSDYSKFMIACLNEHLIPLDVNIHLLLSTIINNIKFKYKDISCSDAYDAFESSKFDQTLIKEIHMEVGGVTAAPNGGCGNMPSIGKQLSGLVKAIITTAKDGFATATPDEAEKRKEICHNCMHITKEFRCTQCGCYMDYKTTIRAMTCPIGKW